jgi:hypothetical protein
MTKHLFSTGVTLIAYGYKTSRDLRWYARRRLQKA